jgi:hypothetical protein
MTRVARDSVIDAHSNFVDTNVAGVSVVVCASRATRDGYGR